MSEPREMARRLRDAAKKARENWPEVYSVPEDLAEDAADVLDVLVAERDKAIRALINNDHAYALEQVWEEARREERERCAKIAYDN